MKKIIYIVSFIMLFACDSEDASDCFQTTGTIVQEVVEVATFDKILVNRNVQLILKQDAETTIVIETGENLLSDVEVKVENAQLILSDNNTCNFVRDYAAIKVYVTAPNITEIRSSTQFEIQSDGVLNYNNLKLLSEDFNAPGTFTVGDFRMKLNSNQVRVTSNNIASFYLSGVTNNLFVGFYSGAGRFEGEQLIAQNVDVYHRGSNDMIVNPQVELTGKLLGTGNLISVNQPPIVEVETLYTGVLIF
ncbi:DUF2807 domain-containing protein [Flavobacteriaceae bacterium 144Ye]|nr:DUF2807 domain-containing protein [Flavobacteriaceae bacterium 144Ye]